MSQFSKLINEQMETMDKLLYIQTEIERCQEIERELASLQKHAGIASIQEEITQMKRDLRDIHILFESQTEELIRVYQELGEAIGK